MRVGLLSCNAQAHNAIGNQVAEKALFFREHGADVRVFLENTERLHLELSALARQVDQVAARGEAWDWLRSADLVIADYAQHYALLHYLPLLLNQKPRLVLDYHGVTPAQHWEGPQRDLLEHSARQRGIVWCADAALTHSQFAKQELHRATGFPQERIHVQPYPTDVTRFRPGPQTDLRQRLRLDNGPILLYVGRLAASKRVSVLIEALPLVPGAQALIVGDDSDVYGSEVRRCEELARQLGVANRVRFLGQVSDAELSGLYRGADLLVIPSLHEGYCLPVIEAMASGLPVVAARTTALPETIGDAGLTFLPDDAADLARQARRALERKSPAMAGPVRKRVAVVAFRFGSQIVGGAEASLGKIGQALQRGGHEVEVFTTCTSHESAWSNDLPAGAVTLDGLTVHRFPIDPHDTAAHHASMAQIVDAHGCVDEKTAQDYLRNSIHSSALLGALGRRRTEFDAIITGPYLFGLTHDVARTFPDQTLLVPCFHDEPYARLPCWHAVYGAVGGVLYHSPEEQDFAESVLGINHPGAREIGTLISEERTEAPAGRYVVYCGRLSRQKNVPTVLEFAERYQRERPGRFPFVFLGQGEVPIPGQPWAEDRGRVSEEEKRRVLSGAAALVQLSTQESLSLVVLESWAQGTPVIVHQDCAVLRAQVARAGGGRAVRDYADFAGALDDLWERPGEWETLGASGAAYVTQRYASESVFRERLLAAIGDLQVPLGEQMRRRGLTRAQDRSRPAWRERFGQCVERVLDEGPITRSWDIRVQTQATVCRGVAGQATLLPVRVVNAGDLPALDQGPAQTQIVAEVMVRDSKKRVGEAVHIKLSAQVLPGQAQPASVPLRLPALPGEYDLHLCAESSMAAEAPAVEHVVPLRVESKGTSQPFDSCFLDTVRASLAEVHRLQRLPDDYLDVTQGRLARWKRWLKQKLLGNFKKAYVDVLSHQQSQVNGHLLATTQQLAEYCATLEHAVRGLQQRLDELAIAEESETSGGASAEAAATTGVEP